MDDKLRVSSQYSITSRKRLKLDSVLMYTRKLEYGDFMFYIPSRHLIESIPFLFNLPLREDSQWGILVSDYDFLQGTNKSLVEMINECKYTIIYDTFANLPDRYVLLTGLDCLYEHSMLNLEKDAVSPAIMSPRPSNDYINALEGAKIFKGQVRCVDKQKFVKVDMVKVPVDPGLHRSSTLILDEDMKLLQSYMQPFILVGNTLKNIFYPVTKDYPPFPFSYEDNETLRLGVYGDGQQLKGIFLEDLGNTYDMACQYEAIMRMYNIKQPEYLIDDSVTFSYENFIEMINRLQTPYVPDPAALNEYFVARELPNRMDLRAREICSIDPVGCTDIDDAVGIWSVGPGKYVLTVQIADVSYFCHPGTPLDREASSRATSVYLANQRFDMLPNILSSELCSLKVGDKLSVGVLWEVELVNGRYVISPGTVHRCVVNMKRNYSYQEAQDEVESFRNRRIKESSVFVLNEIGKQLRAARMEMGAVSIDRGNRIETQLLIEELMLLANNTVARILMEKNREAVIRIHPAPLPDKIALLNERLHALLGITLDFSTPKRFNETYNAIPSEYRNVTQDLVVRALERARYTRFQDCDETYHYGLAMTHYTHFTSPIRRYSDILVHRQLFDSCNGLDPRDLKHINNKFQQAKYAQTESRRIQIYQIIMQQGDLRAEGVVLDSADESTVYFSELDLQVEVPRKMPMFSTVVCSLKRNDELFFVKKEFEIEVLECRSR